MHRLFWGGKCTQHLPDYFERTASKLNQGATCFGKLPFLTALHNPTFTLANEHKERIAEVGVCNATAELAKESASLESSKSLSDLQSPKNEHIKIS